MRFKTEHSKQTRRAMHECERDKTKTKLMYTHSFRFTNRTHSDDNNVDHGQWFSDQVFGWFNRRRNQKQEKKKSFLRSSSFSVIPEKWRRSQRKRRVYVVWHLPIFTCSHASDKNRETQSIAHSFFFHFSSVSFVWARARALIHFISFFRCIRFVLLHTFWSFPLVAVSQAHQQMWSNAFDVSFEPRVSYSFVNDFS